MRQFGLTLTAHPLLPWVWALSLVLMIAWLLRSGFAWRRVVSAGGAIALVTAAVAELGPQPIVGYGSGLTERVCDVHARLPLAPWSWGVADVRVGPILAHVLVGAAALLGTRRGRAPLLLGGLLVAPAGELIQWVFPAIARTCTTQDIADTWAGLAVGVGIAALLIWLSGSPRRALAVGAAIVAVAVVVTAVSVPRGAGDTDLRTESNWGRMSSADRAAFSRWLAAGDDPGAGTRWAGMSRAAMRDVWLSGVRHLDTELPPAGEADGWRMFWPRDGAFLAVALARTGHGSDARRLLARMAQLPFDDDHGLDARFMLDGSPVDLNPRAPQADNCGWVIWAVHQVRATTPLPGSVNRLRDRCTGQLLRLTGAGTHVPGASADYWEVTTWRSSLGVSAPVLLGLRSAAADYRTGSRATTAARSAQRFAGVVREAFGPQYQRFGDAGGLDASACMTLLPGSDPTAKGVLGKRCREYQRLAARPSGGVAPGQEWKRDGISWTPQVSLVAYVDAVTGDAVAAGRRLDWLAAHRPPWGSLPEKVSADGSPAGPAPLLWTSALVLLTLAEPGVTPGR